MPTTAVYPALATNYGGTVIQANSLSLPADTEYEKVPFGEMLQYVKELGGSAVLKGFPMSEKIDYQKSFYRRKDILTASAPTATLAMVTRNSNIQNVKIPNGTGSDTVLPYQEISLSVVMWHVVTITTALGVFNRVFRHGVESTYFRDPQGTDIIVPTSEYLTLDECRAFLLKNVAASAPSYTPSFAAILGQNPNV
jgi:hypothetical protein